MAVVEVVMMMGSKEKWRGAGGSDWQEGGRRAAHGGGGVDLEALVLGRRRRTVDVVAETVGALLVHVAVARAGEPAAAAAGGALVRP
jgi:hypothetical protein